MNAGSPPESGSRRASSALAHIGLPLVVLPMLTSLEREDPSRRDAALVHGAHPIVARWRVTLPQSAPGIQIEYNPAIAAISAALIFVVVLVLVPLERRLGLLTQRGVSGD